MKWGQLETRIASGIYMLTPGAVHAKTTQEDVARFLTRMLTDWEKAHRRLGRRGGDHIQKARDLSREIRKASDTRNTICHGLQAVMTSTSPPYASIVCHVKYLENRIIRSSLHQVSFTLKELSEEAAKIQSFDDRMRDIDQPMRINFPGGDPRQKTGKLSRVGDAVKGWLAKLLARLPRKEIRREALGEPFDLGAAACHAGSLLSLDVTTSKG